MALTVVPVVIGGVTYNVVFDKVGTDYRHVNLASFLSGTTLKPVSAADPLPIVQTGTPELPDGAATEETLATLKESVDALAALLGEVQASPTQNTVLDRLKDLLAALQATLSVNTGLDLSDVASIKTAVDSINDTLTALVGDVDGVEPGIAGLTSAINAVDGHVDGLETLAGTTNTTIAATNALLALLNGYVDGLEGLIGTTNSTLAATNTKLDLLAGYEDGLETLIGATNTALAATNAKLDLLAGYEDGVEGLLGGLATASGQTTNSGKLDTVNTNLGSVTETAPTTDTASSGLNGRLQRIAQRITSLIALIPAALTGSGNFKIAIQEAITLISSLVPATSGGLTPYSLISAATTNGNNVKASAGQVYSIVVTNTSASIRYLKLYNKATTPSPGTDTPVARFVIPASTNGAGFVIDIANGLAFATGIGVGITGGLADNDTTAILANEVVLNLFYK